MSIASLADDVDLNPGPREAFTQLVQHIQWLTVAKRVWLLFSAAERDRLGGIFAKAYQSRGRTLGMWLRAKGGSPVQAIVDIEKALRILPPERKAWMFRELGIAETTSSEASPLEPCRPFWDPAAGRLYFGGKVARKVRSAKIASSLVPLLEKFQAEGWPIRIDWPPKWDEEKRRESVRSFNERAKMLHIEADGQALGVRWFVSQRNEKDADPPRTALALYIGPLLSIDQNRARV